MIVIFRGQTVEPLTCQSSQPSCSPAPASTSSHPSPCPSTLGGKVSCPPYSPAPSTPSTSGGGRETPLQFVDSPSSCSVPSVPSPSLSVRSSSTSVMSPSTSLASPDESGIENFSYCCERRSSIARSVYMSFCILVTKSGYFH